MEDLTPGKPCPKCGGLVGKDEEGLVCFNCGKRTYLKREVKFLSKEEMKLARRLFPRGRKRDH